MTKAAGTAFFPSADRVLPLRRGNRVSFLFALLGRRVRFKQVPVGLLDGIVGVLSALGRIVPSFRQKADLGRIGRYYARESMLVLDPATGRYDAEATPSTGTETLFDYYTAVVAGGAKVERGDHAVF